MKTKVLLIFCILASTMTLFAQSGRIIQPPPTPVNDVKNSPCENEFDEIVFIQPKVIAEFISELNRLGKCGYKLQHLTKFPLVTGQIFSQMQVAGVVSLDRGNNYEYEWFASFIPDDLDSKISPLTKQGFYFRDVLSVTDGECSSPTFPRTQSASEGMLDILTQAASDETKERANDLKKYWDISYGSIIFLERKNQLIHPNYYGIQTAALGWGKNPTLELEKIFDNFWETGDTPLTVRAYKVGNKHDFLVLTENSLIKENPNSAEYKVIKLDKSFEKTINLLANENYEIAFDVVFGVYRYIIMKKSAERKQYQWINWFFKDFAAKLNKIVQQDGHFVAAYSTDFNCDSVESNLLFNVSTSQKQKYDYQILKMSDDPNRKKKSSDDLTASSDNFKGFLREGYKIRELFYADGINVLFERSKP